MIYQRLDKAFNSGLARLLKTVNFKVILKIPGGTLLCLYWSLKIPGGHRPPGPPSYPGAVFLSSF